MEKKPLIHITKVNNKKKNNHLGYFNDKLRIVIEVNWD
jgi:hypothetical protein